MFYFPFLFSFLFFQHFIPVYWRARLSVNIIMLHELRETPYLVPSLTWNTPAVTQSHTDTDTDSHTHIHTQHAHTDTSIHPQKIAIACSHQRCLCWHDWCPQSRRPLLLFLHPIKHKSVDMDQDLSAPMECMDMLYTVHGDHTVVSVVKIIYSKYEHIKQNRL